MKLLAFMIQVTRYFFIMYQLHKFLIIENPVNRTHFERLGKAFAKPKEQLRYIGNGL